MPDNCHAYPTRLKCIVLLVQQKQALHFYQVYLFLITFLNKSVTVLSCESKGA